MPQTKRKGYIKSSSLVLLAFATAFFSRVIDTAGAPSSVNFIHFATVPLACGFAIYKTRSKNLKQIATTKAFLIGILFLLGVMTASTLLNRAGVINLVVDFLLLVEPFLLLLAIICIPMSPVSIKQFRTWLVRFGFIHLLLAFVQKYILRLDATRGAAGEDLIQGVFYFSGAGHVVGASVSMTFGLYYLVNAKSVPLWLRVSVALATFWHMLIADAKQVLLSFLLAWLLLFFTKLKNIEEIIKYLLAAIVVISALIWCTQNLASFSAFNTWMRPEIYGPDGEATTLKFASFRIIPSYFESPLNWLFGLGPGHTVGRLGGWMLREYADLLAPLGATMHPASSAVWDAVGASWLGDQSSMFSPLFGWAGIWGDLGFLGLGAYLYLSFIVWRQLCLDDFSRFLLLSIFVTGLIFSQMEEPGYMLFLACMVGLRWHENRYGSIAKSYKFSESLQIIA